MAAITLRSVKGSELTHGEVDANFTNLNTDKAELASPTFTGVVTSPKVNITSTVDVLGALSTTTATGGYFTFANSGSGVAYFGVGTGITGTVAQDFALRNDNGRILFLTTAVERMRIFAGGGVHIGGTSDPGNTNLQVTGTVAASNLSGTNTGDQTTVSGNAGSATVLQTSRNFSIAGSGITAAAVGFTGAAAVVLAASVDAGHITLARMADVATATVFYRKTAATGVPEVQTLATLKTDLGLTGTNSGDQASIVGITGTKAQFDTAVTDGNIVYVSDPIILPAGSTTVQPLKFVSGTVNTSPVAGVNEYDGSSFFAVETTTSGRGYVPVTYGYNYTGAGSALGPTIADFFPATSSINLLASSVYGIEVVAYFLKSTAGTVVWTWLASSAPNVITSTYVASAVTGFTTTATTTAPITGFAAIQTNTVLAHAATGSLTTAVRHAHIFTVMVHTNAATNLRLRVTSSAGTATPQIGSYYRVTRITTSGAFAA